MANLMQFDGETVSTQRCSLLSEVRVSHSGLLLLSFHDSPESSNEFTTRSE